MFYPPPSIRYPLATLLMALLLPLLSQGQGRFALEYDPTIPVLGAEGDSLGNPWAGGLNSGQYSTLDLDKDGREDLLVFDRTANKLNTFLAREGYYEHAPDYVSLFPKNLDNWVLAVDFNCDGKKDLMASDPFGMRAFTNVGMADGEPQWERSTTPVITSNGASSFNLQMNAGDIPGITDLDGDGDLDIIVFNFVGIGRVEYHKNLSLENTGACGLVFQKVDSRWGDFEECGCDQFRFGSKKCGDSGGRVLHAGAKSIAVQDMDGDGDQEFFMSQEDCSTYYYLKNEGNEENTVLRDPQVPSEKVPHFPALYFLDADFDGVEDMIIAPNTTYPTEGEDAAASSFLFRNQGTSALPDFKKVKPDFLQEGMIDLGSLSVPTFADHDGDGDLDLFVAANGLQVGGARVASLHLFENEGNPFRASFRLKDSDYGQLSSLAASFLNARFMDVTGDGRLDLLFSADIPGSDGALYYKVGQGRSSLDFTDAPPLPISVRGGRAFFQNIDIYDVDRDGRPDLLAGQASGGLYYYRNTGRGGVPAFTLANERFYGIGTSFSQRNLSPHVTDLDGDGKDELLTTSSDGVLRVYGAFLDHLRNPAPGEDRVLKSVFSPETVPTSLGIRTWLGSADLSGEGRTSVTVGGVPGGLCLLGSTSAPSQERKGIINLFPNPVRSGYAGGRLNISVTESVRIQVIDRLGRPIMDVGELQAGENTSFMTAQWAGGLYFILALREGRIVGTEKFIVMR